MTVENKPRVISLMRIALKELGRASYRAIAHQLTRNMDLAESLNFWGDRRGVR
jgi:hypothetical protein